MIKAILVDTVLPGQAAIDLSSRGRKELSAFGGHDFDSMLSSAPFRKGFLTVFFSFNVAAVAILITARQHLSKWSG